MLVRAALDGAYRAASSVSMPLKMRCNLVEYSNSVIESKYLVLYSQTVTTMRARRTFMGNSTGLTNKSPDAWPVKEKGTSANKFAARPALQPDEK